MKTVATFMAGHEAHLARGVLEAEGIHASVIDENTSTTVLYSPAVGGTQDIEKRLWEHDNFRDENYTRKKHPARLV
jgi:hypothetical protein